MRYRRRTLRARRSQDILQSGYRERFRSPGDIQFSPESNGSNLPREWLVTGGTYEDVDRLLLEQLVTSELEGSLEEIASSGRSEASEESAGTLALDDLLEAANEALVVLERVELDTCFYAREGEDVSDGTPTQPILQTEKQPSSSFESPHSSPPRTVTVPLSMSLKPPHHPPPPSHPTQKKRKKNWSKRSSGLTHQQASTHRE